MTAVYDRIIDQPAAWTSRSVGGKAGITHRLGDEQLNAIDEVLARTHHLRPQEMTRKYFDDPILTSFLADMFELIQNGRGAVVISGLTRDRYSEEEFERIYWGFGIHWGYPVTESALGDRLSRVRFTPVGPDNPTNRHYRNNDELTLHTDSNEIVGLMCIQKAEKGGYSQLTSSLAVHNEILETRPDLLPPLYEGFFYANREHANCAQPVTPYKIPVFACIDRKVRCLFIAETMLAAANRDQGAPLRDILPKEGGIGQINTIDMVADTKDPKEAQLYITPCLTRWLSWGRRTRLLMVRRTSCWRRCLLPIRRRPRNLHPRRRICRSSFVSTGLHTSYIERK